VGFVDHYLRVWLLEKTASEAGPDNFVEELILEELDWKRRRWLSCEREDGWNGV
jgi:hypothetical protein